MSKGDTFENDWLKLIFNAVAIAGLADNAVTGALTALTVALHTADPGEGGTQATSEIAYSGYARKSVARTTAGWTVSGNSVSPTVNIDFAAMAGGAGGLVTHWSAGTGVANKLLYKGPLTPNINVVTGTIPRVKSTSTITED